MTGSVTVVWTLDSSTFIHALFTERLWLLPRIRSALVIPEYVFRIELSLGGHESTAQEVIRFVQEGNAAIHRLLLADLDRIASLGAPRRIGMGEITCAVIAEREQGGILLDDWRARRWLEQHLNVPWWESIEDVLLAGAEKGELSEFDLDDCEDLLRRNRYECRMNLRNEFLRRRLSRGQS